MVPTRLTKRSKAITAALSVAIMLVGIARNALPQASVGLATQFSTCNTWAIDITDNRTGKKTGEVFSMKDDYASKLRAAEKTEKTDQSLCKYFGQKDDSCHSVLSKPYCIDHRAPTRKSKSFSVRIDRKCVKPDGSVRSEIYVNGDSIGEANENIRTLIAPGIYPGLMRYSSGARKAQGPFGAMGSKGDFLLEISNVTCADGTPRSDLLVHGGTRAEHSQGCILLGPISKAQNADGTSSSYIQNTDTNLLSKLRTSFYSTNLPNSSPNLDIHFEIGQPQTIPACK